MKKNKVPKKIVDQIGESVRNMQMGNTSNPVDIDKACAKNRDKCNKLTQKEREQLLKKGAEIVDFDTDPNPQIKIHKVTNQPDGSALMDYEVNDAFIKAYMLESGAKEFTTEGLSNWIFQTLEKTIDLMNKHEKSNKKNQ